MYRETGSTWFYILEPGIVWGAGRLLATGSVELMPRPQQLLQLNVLIQKYTPMAANTTTKHRVMRPSEDQWRRNKFNILILYLILTLIHFPATPCSTFGLVKVRSSLDNLY